MICVMGNVGKYVRIMFVIALFFSNGGRYLLNGWESMTIATKDDEGLSIEYKCRSSDLSSFFQISSTVSLDWSKSRALNQNIRAFLVIFFFEMHTEYVVRTRKRSSTINQ